MAFVIQSESPPLREDNDGALRVGSSRVLLEMVIHAFQDGATPEAILQSYSTLTLSDVYSVIGYYLRHPDEIDAYLEQRERIAARVRQEIDAAQPDLVGIRARLRSKRR